MIDEKPILFSGEMIRAILEGRKTQTRRVVNPQPEFAESMANPEDLIFKWNSKFWVKKSVVINRCPYGSIGDQLWVRETWHTEKRFDRIPPISLPRDAKILYRTTFKSEIDDAEFGKSRPSIFMPRWASRIDLRITGLRLERLQEITTQDIFSEGCKITQRDGGYRDWIALWDSINGKMRKNGVDISWAANPWVWVIEFERIP